MKEQIVSLPIKLFHKKITPITPAQTLKNLPMGKLYHEKSYNANAQKFAY